MSYGVENIVRKVELACHNVVHSYISLVNQNAASCDNGLNTGRKRGKLMESVFDKRCRLNILTCIFPIDRKVCNSKQGPNVVTSRTT